MNKYLLCRFGIFFIGFLFFYMSNPVGAKQDDVIELKFATEQPPMTPEAPVWKEWSQKLSEQTNGKVIINFFWAGTIAKGKELRKATIKKMCDISAITLSVDYNAYRLNSVIELPYIGFPDSETATIVRGELIDGFPEVKAEYKGTEILYQGVSLPGYINTTKKAVRTPEDLKGMKICGIGTGLKVLEVLGASPVTVMPTELYLSLDRGVAEGANAPYIAMGALNVLKLLPYHNDTPINYGCFHVVMSSKTWKTLPADVRKAFTDLNPWVAEADLNALSRAETWFRKQAESLGHTFISNTPEEIEVWKEKVKPLHAEWIEDNEKRGLPGQAVYDEVLRLIKKHSE